MNLEFHLYLDKKQTKLLRTKFVSHEPRFVYPAWLGHKTKRSSGHRFEWKDAVPALTVLFLRFAYWRRSEPNQRAVHAALLKGDVAKPLYRALVDNTMGITDLWGPVSSASRFRLRDCLAYANLPASPYKVWVKEDIARILDVGIWLTDYDDTFLTKITEPNHIASLATRIESWLLRRLDAKALRRTSSARLGLFDTDIDSDTRAALDGFLMNPDDFYDWESLLLLPSRTARALLGPLNFCRFAATLNRKGTDAYLARRHVLSRRLHLRAGQLFQLADEPVRAIECHFNALSRAWLPGINSWIVSSCNRLVQLFQRLMPPRPPQLIGKFLAELGTGCEVYGLTPLALDLCENATRIFKRISGSSPESVSSWSAYNLGRLGSVLGQVNDRKGFDLLEEAETRFAAAGDRHGYANRILTRVWLHDAFDEPSAAKRLYDEHEAEVAADGSALVHTLKPCIKAQVFDPKLSDSKIREGVERCFEILHAQEFVPPSRRDTNPAMVRPELALGPSHSLVKTLGPLPTRRPFPFTPAQVRKMANTVLELL